MNGTKGSVDITPSGSAVAKPATLDVNSHFEENKDNRAIHGLGMYRYFACRRHFIPLITALFQSINFVFFSLSVLTIQTNRAK